MGQGCFRNQEILRALRTVKGSTRSRRSRYSVSIMGEVGNVKIDVGHSSSGLVYMPFNLSFEFGLLSEDIENDSFEDTDTAVADGQQADIPDSEVHSDSAVCGTDNTAIVVWMWVHLRG